MCSTCEVPLCVDTVDGDATFTHHLLWHRCLDLREESERCNTLLRERRLEKKRGSIGGGEEGQEIKRGRIMDGVLHQEDIMMQHHEHHGHVQHHQHHEEHASEMMQHGHHESGHGEHSVQYHDDGLNVEPVNVNQV